MWTCVHIYVSRVVFASLIINRSCSQLGYGRTKVLHTLGMPQPVGPLEYCTVQGACSTSLLEASSEEDVTQWMHVAVSSPATFSDVSQKSMYCNVLEKKACCPRPLTLRAAE